MHWKPGSWILIGLLLATLTSAGTAQLATTHVADTIYRADGNTAKGSAIISWPAFTSSGGTSIPSGNTSALIAASGALSVDLVPNAGATPLGTYYTVVYHLDDGSTTRQYWVVPQSASAVKVSAIESSVMPTSVAMQTVSKSYVDTAIAAAVTGYPLESTPYVLKTGDTLSGPLLLPADPVSSMQAASKHYVDESVAVLASGIDQSGTTPQATQNTVPAYIVSPSGGIASQGPTHVTVDPTGYNLSGFHSAWTNLGVNSTPSDCNFPGPTYINGSCVYQSTIDTGTSALSGHNTRFDAYGPGGNPTVNAGEGPSTVVMSDDGYLANAAVRNIWQSTTAAFGVGDFVGMNWFHTGNAGVAFPSDEGVELVKNDGGQQEYWGGAARGYFSASIAAGGAGTQTPVFSNVHGCTNLFQKCVPSAGTQLLDISQGGDTGFFTGKSVVFAAAPLPWLAQMPTTGGLTKAPAWGYQLGARLAPNTVTDTPVAQTLTLQGGAGTFTSGLACVIGSNYEEQAIITSVSGSAPTQTLHLPLAYPNRDVAIFQGACKFISFNGDLALGTRTAYPGVSIDGTNLIYSVPNYGNMGWIELPIANSEPETTAGAGDPNSGFATFCGARITKLTGLNPLATSLEQNGCRWATNDAVEDPDFPIQNVIGYTSRINMNNPSGPNAGLVGAKISISGMGAAGGGAALELNNLFADTNCAPYNIGGCGGNLTPPSMIVSNPLMPGGFWNDDIAAHYAPKNSVIEFGDHVPGQTSYSILRDPWATIDLNSSGAFTFHNTITANGMYTGSLNGIPISGLSGRYLCLNHGSGYCPDGGADAGSNVEGIELDTQHAVIGGTLGHFGSVAVQANTPGDTQPGGNVQLFGSNRADALKNSVLIGNNSGAAIEVDGDQPGHNPGNVGIGYASGSSIPQRLAVNGNSLTVGTHTASEVDAGVIFSGPHVASHGANATAFFASSGLQTAEIEGANPANARAAFTFSSNFGGAYTPNWEVGTDIGIAGVKDFYWYNYATGSAALYLDAATDAATFHGQVSAPALSANVYKGPATAPTGACSVVGWAFSQDGHISFCNGTVWVMKI